MKTKEFSFNLPQQLIAQHPSHIRGQSRLLVVDRQTESFFDTQVNTIAELLEPHSVLVINNSKVRKARLYGTSDSGARVEFLFLYELSDHSWVAMTTKSKKQSPGKRFHFLSPQLKRWDATIVGEAKEGKVLRFDQGISEEFFEQCGHIPLPPYIKREDEEEDELRYQTIYAQNEGSVAAPTAGLHFTQEIFASLEKRHITICPITLHVGLGTFLPMRSENIEDHPMHTEQYEISFESAAMINQAKKEHKKIVAVGTTSVRSLESAWDSHSKSVIAQKKSTNLFIKPPYDFKVVDQLLTNFHTPESTLLVLVSAFASKNLIFAAYEHAVAQEYRFFSYGDAMLIR
ncbi:MAG: tRNA preQ1(34) S-adenosylmethionine ribosyltransferase-isomerase QueA [Sphaerochaetaceae bacterium]|jgi:S-adenosylmethionine:tRNA ribosyltransferase-isomerase